MRLLPDDIVRFIDRHFHQNDFAAVCAALQDEVFQTDRVLRAVLHLSNGSLMLLKHYAAACAVDVRDVLTRAEYVVGVSEMPMAVRDMSLPFDDPRNSGERPPPRRSGRPNIKELVMRIGPKVAPRSPRVPYHGYIVGWKFTLGRVVYTVASEQPRRDKVWCFRSDRDVTSLVALPLDFVIAHVAEKIELTMPGELRAEQRSAE